MGETKARKVWDVFLKVSVPLSFLIGSVMVGHEIRLTRIESNRFTASDGVQIVADLKEYIKANAPPGWLRDDMTEIKTSLREIDKRLRSLESK